MRIGKASAEISLGSQFRTVFLRHIFIGGLAAVFGIGAFWWFLTQRIYNVIYSCIFTCIYIGMMYTKCYKVASHDLKGYAQTKAYPAKGIVLILPVLAVTLILDVVRVILWKYAADSVMSQRLMRIAVNTVFIVWDFAFNGIMAVDKEYVSLAGRIAIYGVPLLSAWAGYYAGYKRFDIVEKILPFIYEKDSDEK